MEGPAGAPDSSPEPQVPELGWYAAPDGTNRYWDGSVWLAPNPGTQPPILSADTHRTKRKRHVLVPLAFVTVLLLAVGGAVFSIERQNEKRAHASEEARIATERAEAEARTSEAAEAAADAQRTQDDQLAQEEQEAADARADAAEAAQARDKHMTEVEPGDWYVVESGSLYYRFADETEVECGNWTCTGVFVHSVTGCDGVYVEAAVESNGVVVGMANDLIGSLLPNQSGGLFLEDFTDQGDTFRITEVRCQ